MTLLFLRNCVFLLTFLCFKTVSVLCYTDSRASTQLYSRISVNRLHSTFVAEIRNISLHALSGIDQEFISIQLLLHKVLIFRNQSEVSVEDIRQFTESYGDLHVHLESSSHLSGYKDVNIVSNIRNNETGLINGLYGNHVETYHSDLSWTDVPCKVTLLKSVIRPDDCGDTQFLDSQSAFYSLNESWKERLSGLYGKFCYLTKRNTEVEVGLTAEEIQEAMKCSYHPIISTHPISGLKNIYANPGHTASVVTSVGGEVHPDSDTILSFLFQHTQNERFRYQHRWRDNDIVLWDNRGTQHRATGCPAESPRMLVRTTALT